MRTLSNVLFLIIVIGLLVVGFWGCGVPNARYQGSVKVNRTNGKIQSMEIKFPTSSYSTNIRSKADVDAVIEQLEKTIKDMKAAREEWEE